MSAHIFHNRNLRNRANFAVGYCSGDLNIFVLLATNSCRNDLCAQSLRQITGYRGRSFGVARLVESLRAWWRDRLRAYGDAKLPRHSAWQEVAFAARRKPCNGMLQGRQGDDCGIKDVGLARPDELCSRRIRRRRDAISGSACRGSRVRKRHRAIGCKPVR